MWHLGGVFIRIAGKLHHLWRALDKDGIVIGILVQSRRNAKAVKREILPHVEHRQSHYLNNYADNSQRPTRRRERQMQRFKSARHAQQFLFVYGPIYGHSRSQLHCMSASAHRTTRTNAFRIWQEETYARCPSCLQQQRRARAALSALG